MLGIICGFEAEAVAARSVAGARVVNAAARPQFARWQARELIKQGATQLLSFGLAGGLAPDLPVGSCVIGTHVISADARVECDAEWSARLMRHLPMAHCGSVWGAEMIVATPRDKKSLYQRTRSLITDMESHCVAQIAAEQHVPFAVVRVVVDTASQTLPPAALVPLREDGNLDGRGVAFSILRRPWQLPDLIKLGKANKTAMQVLREAVKAGLL